MKYISVRLQAVAVTLVCTWQKKMVIILEACGYTNEEEGVRLSKSLCLPCVTCQAQKRHQFLALILSKDPVQRGGGPTYLFIFEPVSKPCGKTKEEEIRWPLSRGAFGPKERINMLCPSSLEGVPLPYCQKRPGSIGERWKTSTYARNTPGSR